jgi:hypothetical protein
LLTPTDVFARNGYTVGRPEFGNVARHWSPFDPRGGLEQIISKELAPDQLETLRAYAAGSLGTRETSERDGLHDYADLLAALAQNELDVPKPTDSPERDAGSRGRAKFSSRACVVAGEVRLIVTDAPPLITLAIARMVGDLVKSRAGRGRAVS